MFSYKYDILSAIFTVIRKIYKSKNKRNLLLKSINRIWYVSCETFNFDTGKTLQHVYFWSNAIYWNIIHRYNKQKYVHYLQKMASGLSDQKICRIEKKILFLRGQAQLKYIFSFASIDYKLLQWRNWHSFHFRLLWELYQMILLL